MTAVSDTTVTSITSTSTGKRLETTHDADDANYTSSHTTHITSSSSLHDLQCSSKQHLIFDDEDLLLNIFSFVGKYHYCFIGSVNQTFYKVYVDLYQNKRTRLNATTMELAIFCRTDILKRGFVTWIAHALLLQSAVQGGNKDVIQYILEFPTYTSVGEMDWRYNLCPDAAEYGNLELLQWAVDSNLYVDKLNERTCILAIGNGHRHIFDWAIQNGFSIDIGNKYVYRMIAGMAAKKGLLDIIQWLYQKCCDDGVHARFCRSFNVCEEAAEGGHLEVLQWLRSVGFSWCSIDVFFLAIKGNNVEVVRYMMDNGFDEIYGAGRVAARYGCMSILKFLQSLNYEFVNDEIDYAAGGGHLDIVQWALENGYPMTKSTSYFASLNDQLSMLKWLFAKGCPWDESTTTYAATKDICLFAKCNGCPVGRENPLKRDDPFQYKFWQQFPREQYRSRNLRIPS